MKTISVKEAAQALGLSTRAVQYKLQNGDLKGTRTKNQYGVAEWRVWPNKDIAEALAKQKGQSVDDEINFSPADAETIEAEEVQFNETEEEPDQPSNWRQVEMERLELMAEKLVKPLAERIEAQAVALSEQEKVIEDQKRQLRLLPDLQKQAEDERKAAELRALESEALRKQIEAMTEEKIALESKALEAAALAEDVRSLKAKMEVLQQPWWKKWFLPPADEAKQ